MSTKVEQGFTLVETLTVIAIISVLAGILFAVSAPSRESARQSVCAEQLHQVHTAVLLYSSDVGAGEELPGLGDLSDVSRYGHNVLDGYLKNHDVLTCPDFPAELKGVLWSTYTWWPVSLRSDASPAEEDMVRRQRDKMMQLGSAYPMWVCGIHDEIYFRPKSPGVNPLLVEPFIVEVSVGGSLFKGRRPYPGSNTIEAARAYPRS